MGDHYAAQRLVSVFGCNFCFERDDRILLFYVYLKDDGSVYAARDPKGFRPMVLGHGA